jgi:hypothetical protein
MTLGSCRATSRWRHAFLEVVAQSLRAAACRPPPTQSFRNGRMTRDQTRPHSSPAEHRHERAAAWGDRGIAPHPRPACIILPTVAKVALNYVDARFIAFWASSGVVNHVLHSVRMRTRDGYTRSGAHVLLSAMRNLWRCRAVVGIVPPNRRASESFAVPGR